MDVFIRLLAFATVLKGLYIINKAAMKEKNPPTVISFLKTNIPPVHIKKAMPKEPINSIKGLVISSIFIVASLIFKKSSLSFSNVPDSLDSVANAFINLMFIKAS